MEHYEMVEQLVLKTGVTYEEAKEALETCNWDLWEAFDYLEKLRQSGATNMYGATPYLQEEFPELRYDRDKAKEILLAWIKTFEPEEGDAPC